MSSTDLSGLRERIRDLREGLGWSQRELARRSGLSASTVRRIEDGTLDPLIATLDRVAKALGVEGSYRISGASHASLVID